MNIKYIPHWFGRRHALVLLAGVLLVTGVLLYTRRSSPQHRIRRDLRELAELAQKSAEENPLRSAGVARRLGEAFVEDAIVSAPPYLAELRGRAAITAAMAQIRMSHRDLQLSLRDINVLRIDPGGRQAEVVLTVLGSGRYGGGSYRDVHEFNLTLERVGRQWLIASATRTEIFE